MNAPKRTAQEIANDIQEAICDAWRIEHLTRMADEDNTEWGQHVARQLVIDLAARMNTRIGRLALEVERLSPGDAQPAPVVADKPKRNTKAVRR